MNEWLLKLKEYWLSKDVDKVMTLFEKTTFYQETPFMKPYTTFEEIKEDWNNIKNTNIQDVNFKVLAIDGLTLIAEWYLKVDNIELDGIYEIKFDNNLNCISFRSWEMEK